MSHRIPETTTPFSNYFSSNVRTPINTPVMNTKQSQSLPRLNTVNQSPASKTRKWTDRLTKFQKSSQKRTISSPLTSPRTKFNSQSPLSFQRSSSSITPNSSYRQNQYHPTRTSSLPKLNSKTYSKSNQEFSNSSQLIDPSPTRFAPSPDQFSDINNITQPNFRKKSLLSSRSKKSFINESCTLCEELISSKVNGERIIELECKHICHQECLSLSMSNLSNHGSASDFHSIFPECTQCLEEKHQTRQCIPKNDDLRDRLVSNILINQSSSSPTTYQTIDNSIPTLISPTTSPTVISQITTPISQIQSQTIFQTTPTISNSSLNIPLDDPPLRRNRPSNKRNVYFQSQNKQNRAFRQSYNANIERYYLSSPSFITSENNENISIPSSNNVPIDDTQLPLIRSYFSEVLLNSFKERLVNWKIDEYYGLLRLVDYMNVSYDNKSFNKCCCFLFEKALIITLRDETIKSGKINDLSSMETNFKSLRIYTLLDNTNIDTVNSSTLHCNLIQEDSNEQSDIFLTEYTNNDNNDTIQKWISGLLDHEIAFDQQTITSTIQLPPIIKNINPDSNDTGTSTGWINSTRMVELGSFQRNNGSVLIRRNFDLPQHVPEQDKTNTTLSMMTSISSIISLKRDRPDQLFLVLQLDFDKLMNEDDSHLIFNSIKALNLKYPSMKFCLVDKNGYILILGDVKDNVTELEDISKWKYLSPKRKFDPVFVKQTGFPGEVVDNLGVVSISNSNMDETKSCLFQNFKSFRSSQRKRQNELKIKIGYLNVDYSNKINELIEVDSWVSILETLCYSFNIFFDEEDDIQSLFTDSNTSSIYSLTENNENESDQQSLVTLRISSPYDSKSIDKKYEIYDLSPDIESLHISLRSQDDNGERPETKTEHTNDFNSHKMNRKSYSSVLNKIEDAINDLNDDDFISSEGERETNPNEIPIYHYL